MSSASVNPQQQHPPATTSSQSVPSSSSVAVKRSLQHCTGSPASCQLADAELWRRFHEVGNEMIVTKAGRRMFPVIGVSISGLDPDALYSICVEFHPADDNRYKYVGGQWVIAAKSQLHDVPVPTYWHPEIPNFGSHWMGGLVSFGKLKLTNKDKLDKSQVSLVTLHLYQPTIRIIRVAGQNERFTVATFTFPETRFMAVTSYQNEDVTSLKVRYNPFAQKVFQDMAKGRSCGTGAGSSSNDRDDDGDDEPDLSPSVDSTIAPPQQQHRPSASTTTKMMKSASGAVATATLPNYNRGQVSPPQQTSSHRPSLTGQSQQQQQQQQQQQSSQSQQPRHSVNGGLILMEGMGSGMVQDFSSFMQQPRYNFAAPTVDQFGPEGSFFTTSAGMYPHSAAAIGPYQHPASAVGCFSTNGPSPTSIASIAPSTTPAYSSAAAAAAAYAASYSNMLSSSLPPVAHNSVVNSAAPAFWPGFMYPTAPSNQPIVSAPSFQHSVSTLTMLNNGKPSSSSVTGDSLSSGTPSTPSGPSSNNNNSGNNSRTVPLTLMRLGVTTTVTNNQSSSSTVATPTSSSLQSLTNRPSSDTSAGGSATLLNAGVLKASPPESGYCGSPPVGDDWSACAYQQLGQRPSSSNNSSLTVITSLTSATNNSSANSTAY